MFPTKEVAYFISGALFTLFALWVSFAIFSDRRSVKKTLIRTAKKQNRPIEVEEFDAR